jgi:hypothetical protein
MAERVLKTAFGPVNAAALERLRESFETQRLLEAVDQIDRAAELAGDASFRKELLRLHAMAHAIINGAPRTASGRETIWELAGPWPWSWKRWWKICNRLWACSGSWQTWRRRTARRLAPRT